LVLCELLVTDEYGFVKDLGTPKFIIDGGANIGLTSIHFLQQYPSARTISVEPFAETFEVCQKNLASYAERATTIQGAIWPKAGTVSLAPQSEEWANQVRDPAPGETGTAEAFTMTDLIALCGGAVDLLKLDVEGAEKEIFRSGATRWLPFVRNIVIELHDEECVTRLVKRAIQPAACFQQASVGTRKGRFERRLQAE
jgi:FkbM family methyltransferase